MITVVFDKTANIVTADARRQSVEKKHKIIFLLNQLINELTNQLYEI